MKVISPRHSSVHIPQFSVVNSEFDHPGELDLPVYPKK
jgi:hypothetical protein